MEQVLDEVVFLQEGHVILHDNVDAIREREGKSVDALFPGKIRMGGQGGKDNVW